LEHAGIAYSPGRLSHDLLQSVRFPPASTPSGSTKALISSLREFVLTYVQLRPEAVDLLVAFVLASWFADCMSIVPVLHLFGPDSAISQVMHLLACLCRRSLLLGDLDIAGLVSLPNGLDPTLLINQRHLSQRVRRALIASNRRHFSVVHGSRCLDLYGAKVFACGDASLVEQGLSLSLSPGQAPVRSSNDNANESIARGLQGRLLRYRMLQHDRVGTIAVDCTAFIPEMREEARSWLAPILACDELYKSVFEEILRQSQEAAGSRFFDPKFVILDALLTLSHTDGAEYFFVGDLAKRVNAILWGRHEELALSARKVGSILSELGIRGERVTQGYRIALTDKMRKNIHRLASEYRVTSIQDGVRRCADCRDGAVVIEHSAAKVN